MRTLLGTILGMLSLPLLSLWGTPVRSHAGSELEWVHGGQEPPALQVRIPTADKALVLNKLLGPRLVREDGEVMDIGATLSAVPPSAHLPALTGTIGENPWGLTGTSTLTIPDRPTYLVQTLSLTATRDLPIRELVYLEATIPHAELIGQVDGSLLRTGDFFLAIEHPLARITALGKDRWRWSLPRGNTLQAGHTWTFHFVIGCTPGRQFRRGFAQYLESRRAHPYRPFIHYNSWYHLNIGRPDYHMTERQCLATVAHIGRELTRARGITLDAFVWDDGWDDHHSLWDFHQDFPNGFRDLHRAAGVYGADLGVWMSPWGGYGTPRRHRLQYGTSQGYETNQGGFSMAGAKYGAAFRRQCFNMMDQHGVRFFKFDGMGSGNVVRGAQGEAADDIDAVLDLTRALRQKDPEVFISATIGTWPSPFWLLYVDSIWRQGEDTGFAGVGNHREQWITYKDGHTHEHIVRQAPIYPIGNLMNGGLVIGEHANPAQMERDEASVCHEIRAMIGSGTCLQELYIAPHLLTPAMWDALAESIRWLRTRKKAFADIHWVGGDPLALEVYGWGGWSTGESGVLTIRNPSDQAAIYPLDLIRALDLPPDTLAARYRLTAPYPRQRVPTLELQPGVRYPLPLEPFEVLSFDLVPVAEAGAAAAGTYADWIHRQQAEEQPDDASPYMGSWTYPHAGHTYTRTFFPDGRAQLAIDGTPWAPWSNRRWHMTSTGLVVTAPGAPPERHRLTPDQRLVLPAGLGRAVKQAEPARSMADPVMFPSP